MNEKYNSMDMTPERLEAVADAAPGASAPRTKRRRPKTEKELYAEAAERAKSLKEKLLARRAKNRDHLIEDLYGVFEVEAIDGDLDEADRLIALRSMLNARLGYSSKGVR
ncbi:hypothetical protein [Arthrobacter sp.]|uniref:hypothetical protein n=1 Tax=Arthrobacter sp. TaxID=1667 RepID=UPI003A94FE65